MKADFHIVDGARHYKLYDTPEYVTDAIDRFSSFYRKYPNAA
jgi:hypothetical protein